jgi:hypothetical protein
MQPTGDGGNHKRAARARTISLDITDRRDALDRRLAEAMERIERVRSKALAAVGTMLMQDS